MMFTNTGLLSYRGKSYLYFRRKRTMSHNRYEMKSSMEIKPNVPAKRVDIVSLRLVKESSVLYRQRVVRSPQDGYDLLQTFLTEADREYFLVVCLDTKNHPTSINVCHVGSLNASITHPREVMKTAVLTNAASILIAHNHPSGDPTPSQEDISVTERLVQAGEIMGIEVLDHLIIGDGEFISLKEKGYM
jgi:DNA repair protein RadC